MNTQQQEIMSKISREAVGDILNGKVGSIRGHFWVKLEDGTIIDPYFTDYYYAIKYMKNLEGDRVYRECDKEIQRQEITRVILPYMKMVMADEDFKKLREIKLDKNIENPPLTEDSYAEGYCHLNAIANKIILGAGRGKIVYGDMGWKMRDSDEIFYEYEHGWDGKHDTRIDPMEMVRRLIEKPNMMKMLMKKHELI